MKGKDMRRAYWREVRRLGRRAGKTKVWWLHVTAEVAHG